VSWWIGDDYGRSPGLPIVFVPMFADQRTNAQLISVAGRRGR